MNKELEILETLKVIMDRLDDIEEKINTTILSNNDPYNLNDYFRDQNTQSYKLSDRFDLTGASI